MRDDEAALPLDATHVAAAPALPRPIPTVDGGAWACIGGVGVARVVD